MPTFFSPNSDRIKIADDQPGYTLGHKIEQAINLLGGDPGEVWVFGEGSIETEITLNSMQVLRFFPGSRFIRTGLINLRPASMVIGPGPELATFFVQSSRSEGVFRAIGGEPGPCLEGFKIGFDQPDSSSNFIQHGPVLRAEDTPRTQIKNLKVERAWTAFEMTGNSGGSRLESIDISAFRFGVNLDGSLDSVRLQNIHFWPFGLTSLQQIAFFDGETYGIRVGRVDDLQINGYLNISHCGLLIEGQTFGHVVNSNFDSKLGIHMSVGSLQVSGCHFSSIGPAWIVHLGGELTLSSCNFFGIIAFPGIIAQGGDDSSLIISSSIFNTLHADFSSIKSSGSNVIVTNNSFHRDLDLEYNNATVKVTQGRITFTNNRTRDKGEGLGNFLEIEKPDSWNRIAHNSEVGWQMIF